MTKLDYEFVALPTTCLSLGANELKLFAIMLHLSRRLGDEDGWFYHSQKSLSKMMGCSQRYLRRITHKLEDLGILKVTRYNNGDSVEGYAMAHDYHIVMDKVLELPEISGQKRPLITTKNSGTIVPLNSGTIVPLISGTNLPKLAEQNDLPIKNNIKKEKHNIDGTTKDVTSIGETCPDETRLVEGKKERDEIPNEDIESYGQDVLTNDGCDEPLMPSDNYITSLDDKSEGRNVDALGLTSNEDDMTTRPCDEPLMPSDNGYNPIGCDDDGGNEVSEVVRANGMNDESEAKAERQQNKDITSTPRVDISGNGDSSKDILAHRREGEGLLPPTPTADVQRRIEEERATLMASIERLKDDMYHAKTTTQFQAFKDEAQHKLDRLMAITPPDFLQDFLTRYDRWYEKTSPYFICNQGTSVRKPTEGEYARLDGYGQGITYAHDMEETKRAFNSLCLYTDYLCREYSCAGTEIVDRMTGHMRLARNNNPNFVMLVDSE